MKCLHNNNGLALITALMITLLSLVIVMGILYVVTQGIKTGASSKVYRNAVEASYGGTNVTMYEIIPQLAAVILEDPTPTATKTQAALTSLTGTGLFGGSSKINLQFAPNSDACLNQKLLKDPSGTNWDACPATATSVKPSKIKESADMTFSLKGVSGTPFTVYSKIVDTVPGTTYMPPPPGGPMSSGGVAETGTGGINLGRHFIYRIEVIGEKSTNASEQGNLTVMYEY